MMRTCPLPRLVIACLAVTAFSLGACTGAATPPAGSGGTSGQGGGSSTTPPTAGGANPGSQGGGGDAAALDACRLLTQEEIKAQFNVEVGPPAGSRPGESSPICNWSRVAAGPGLAGVSLTAGELDQDYFDYVKANSKNMKEVAGLGDAAYFETPVNPFTLDWKMGNLQFNLYVQAGTQSLTDDALRQLVVNLANDVLAHL